MLVLIYKMVQISGLEGREIVSDEVKYTFDLMVSTYLETVRNGGVDLKPTLAHRRGSHRQYIPNRLCGGLWFSPQWRADFYGHSDQRNGGDWHDALIMVPLAQTILRRRSILRPPKSSVTPSR